MDTELALKINKLVHNECKDVPHDIGIKIVELVTEHQNELKKCSMPVVVASKRVTCTLGWDGAPTTCEDGMVLPRKAEMIINAKYYPSGKVGEWPKDPKTGKDLEIYRAY